MKTLAQAMLIVGIGALWAVLDGPKGVLSYLGLIATLKAVGFMMTRKDAD